jgi:hypothetical protein
MKYLFVAAFFFISVLASAQCKAIVLDTNQEFGLSTVSIDSLQNEYKRHCEAYSQAESKEEFQFRIGPSIIVLVDSVLVNGSYHQFVERIDDDNFIGGRPNHVVRNIVVESLGRIYYSSNFFDTRLAVMLWVEDEAKQKLLEAVYNKLSNAEWPVDWKQYATLCSAYNYNSVQKELDSLYQKVKNSLVCESATYTVKEKRVYAKVNIRNTSDVAVFVPKGTNVAPRLANYQTEGGMQTWDLLETTYGVQFVPLRDSLVLKPNEHIEIQFEFPDLGLFHSLKIIEYQGVQFYSYADLHQMLYNADLSNPELWAFPFATREVKMEVR